MGMDKKQEQYHIIKPVELMHASERMHEIVAGYNRCVGEIQEARVHIQQLTTQVRKLSAGLEKVLALVEAEWRAGHKAEFARLATLARDEHGAVAGKADDT